MSQSRSFACPSDRYEDLIGSMQDWFAHENFECQRLTVADGGCLLQVQKIGSWRKFVGMSTAVNVVFHHVDSTLNVEIGAGRWLDKGAVATVSLFVLWPLAVTAAVGAWGQAQFPERIMGRVAYLLAQA